MNGEISLSKARRIAPVLTQENCEEWIGKASELKQRDLEKEVAIVNPKTKIKEGMKPIGPRLVQVTMALTPEAEAILKRIQELESQRTKSPAQWNEVILAMGQEYLERKDPLLKAKRVSSRKQKAAPIPKPGRHPISAQVRHQVNLRDRNQKEVRVGKPVG